MQAEIITIGDELLIGQVVDTNSAWLGSTLGDDGIKVIQITSVQDNAAQIVQAVNVTCRHCLNDRRTRSDQR